jgi:hypothetical protein
MPPRVRHVPFVQRRTAAWLAALPWLGPGLARVESSAVRDAIEATPARSPVWICGMARSGSTILLELLDALPTFASHHYSDYPWLWTPYWRHCLRAALAPKPAVPRERAHRDRILVTADSPEAFEEVFWMHFFAGRHDPARSQVLDADTRHPTFERFFDEHQRKLVAVRGARRYLAKANYHLPRIGYLRRLHADARFLIPLREPVAQVASLVRQDVLFTRLDAQDPAVAAHLARVGHFEFGPQKRALNSGDAEATQAIAACFDRGDVAQGYAHQWVAQYAYALDRMQHDAALANACLWVEHDRLCAHPVSNLESIAAHLALDETDSRRLVHAGRARLRSEDHADAPFDAATRRSIEQITAPLWRRLQAWIEQGNAPD